MGGSSKFKGLSRELYVQAFTGISFSSPSLLSTISFPQSHDHIGGSGQLQLSVRDDLVYMLCRALPIW